MTVGGVTVDVCKDGCAGIWFDQGELRKFDDLGEVATQGLLDIPPDPELSVDLSRRRRCPKCPDIVLMRHFFSAKRAVVVDECPTCAGVWLDAGELRQIRSEYPSEAARIQGARKEFEEVLIDDRMKLIREETGAELPYDTARSRLASSLLVISYLIGAQAVGGAIAAVRIGGFCVVPLACIWFPEALGNSVRGRITRESPRSFVWFFGWLVLLLPLIQVAIVMIQLVRR